MKRCWVGRKSESLDFCWCGIRPLIIASPKEKHLVFQLCSSVLLFFFSSIFPFSSFFPMVWSYVGKPIYRCRSTSFQSPESPGSVIGRSNGANWLKWSKGFLIRWLSSTKMVPTLTFSMCSKCSAVPLHTVTTRYISLDYSALWA